MHKFGFGFLEENDQVLSFLTVTLRFVGNRRVHGDFENIFTFETPLGSHVSNQKTKPETKGSRSQRIRTLDIQATKHKHNHKYKHNRTRVEISGS